VGKPATLSPDSRPFAPFAEKIVLVHIRAIREIRGQKTPGLIDRRYADDVHRR
jgi:hypothetical protein